MNKGFLFRRLGFIVPVFLKTPTKGYIKLSNKHNISSFQDVYINPFYWDALLSLSFIPKQVFDLGANFGFFTSLCHQVFAYKQDSSNINYTLIEANKNLAEKLENLARQVDSQISIKYGAAGPTESIFFSTNKANLLASSISNKGVLVPYIDFNLLNKPDLLKIDIEGAEALLFENYFNWVKCARAIIVEFHYSGNKLAENLDQLITAGFELKIDKLEGSGYRNQLWIKKES